MKKIAACFLVGLGFFSCADFIEYPLEKEYVNLRAPGDSLETRDSVLTFWWDSHQDAKYYRIQIVHPSFEAIKTMVTDSVVLTNQLELELDSGTYAWRVRPENDGSVGLFQEVRSLRIRK